MTDVRAAVKAALNSFRRSGWELAEQCAQIVEQRLWQDWGFASCKSWYMADLPQIADNFRHYVRAGTFIRALPESEREQWKRYPVWSVIAGAKLLDEQPQALLTKLAAGATQAEIRRTVAEALPDQHEEHEWRTIKLRVSLSVYEQWQRALHRAAYESCKDTPTADDLVEAVAAATVNEPLYQPANGIDAATWHDAVHSGKIRCTNCGSRNRTQLDWHHTVARSANGHESLQVPLCRRCHTEIQPRWREWLTEQGLTEG